MPRMRAVRLGESPVAAVALLGVSVALALGWSKANARQTPPVIAGFAWAQHPNALLVTLPEDDCGCAKITDVVRQGLYYQQDVVVLSSQPQEPLEALRREGVSFKHLFIVTNASPAIISRFSSHKKIGAIRIRDGRIVRQSEGGVPGDSFWK